MPKKRTRTTDRCTWSQEDMKAAIIAVKDGEGLRASARRFDVPLTSLQERVKRGEYYKGRMGNRPTFTEDQEKEIADHLLKLAKMFYGMTPAQLRRAVFSYTVKLSIPHKFNKDKEEAGKNWMYGFMRRHLQLSFGKPEATSINRIRAFNKTEIQRFFENLTSLMEKFKFPPTHIFNVDETGITTVNRPIRIIGPKGQKQIGAVTSGERGKNITVCCCMSASGSFTPPLFIYPRIKMALSLERDGPPGSIYACTKSGWMIEDVFLVWLQHFSKINNANKDNPTLLILDNHTSHISLPIYEFCKERQIHMLSIPPHTSHKIQPLDLSFFSSLKKAYDHECDLFLKSKPYERILMTDVNGLFTKAYIRVCTVGKAIKGFSTAAIYPINPGVFEEEDFYTTHQNRIENPVEHRQALEEVTPPNNQHPRDRIRDIESVAGCSRNLTDNMGERENIDDSFLSIIPLPSKAEKNNPPSGPAPRRKKQKSVILTSTPFKQVLVEKQRKKVATVNKKIKTTKKGYVRKINVSSSDEDDIDENKICNDDEDDDLGAPNFNDNGNDGEPCLVCSEYGKNEIWYRCVACGGWVHKLCSGADRPSHYLCDFCQ